MLKRVNIKTNGGILYKNHYLISDMTELNEYHQLIGNSFTVSESEIKNNKTWIGHGHSILTGVAGMGCGMIEKIEERDPMLYNLKLLKSKMLLTQLNYILEGCLLVANEKMGYFPIKPSDSYEVEEILDSNEYLESDIQINKWWGGKHYYAKIKKIDVVDENGEVKWNTEERAREVALSYLSKLNQKQLQS